jgi:molybdopterin converting factor small subunit
MTITSIVTVRVLLFARYAELFGAERVDVRVPATIDGATTVGAVVAALRERPGGELLPARPLVAMELRQVGLDASVAEGDELALLPPLAGG